MDTHKRFLTVQQLHDLEAKGESAATPAIALAGVLLVVIPVLLFIASVTFAAYYLSS
jgi:hypothetical protein